jgi:hypothetical protein
LNIDGKNMLKSDQAACQFAHGSLLMARCSRLACQLLDPDEQPAAKQLRAGPARELGFFYSSY